MLNLLVAFVFAYFEKPGELGACESRKRNRGKIFGE